MIDAYPLKKVGFSSQSRFAVGIMAVFKYVVFAAPLLIVAATSSARAGCSMSPVAFFTRSQ